MSQSDLKTGKVQNEGWKSKTCYNMMTSNEVKIQLTAIRANLPPQFSQSAARRLMSSYENYKHILQVLGQSYSSISAGVRAALPEIETAIREAIKGTPKKDAEEC